MGHKRRMHPDDLKDFINGISENLRAELRELHSKENTIKDLGTLSLKETAKILGCHFSTVKRHIEKGLLEGVKPGKDWRVTQESLKKYLDGKKK